jgi:hypothetical protein
VFRCRLIELARRITTLPHVLEETEHFYRGPQEKVAKIVQCGEHSFLNRLKDEATTTVASSFRELDV